MIFASLSGLYKSAIPELCSAEPWNYVKKFKGSKDNIYEYYKTYIQLDFRNFWGFRVKISLKNVNIND